MQKHKIKRILCACLAGVMLLTNSAVPVAAADPDSSVAVVNNMPEPKSVEESQKTETVATGETGAAEQMAEGEQEDSSTVESSETQEETLSTRISITVEDGSYTESDDYINESLFTADSVSAEMPYGTPVPLYFQIDKPADGGTTTVTLTGDAAFTDSDGRQTDTGDSYAVREYQDTDCGTWVMWVQSESDFSATLSYSDGATSITKTAVVTMRDTPMLFAARDAETQYHITAVNKVNGEWLITFEGTDSSYCMDEGLNGRPSASVYWTYYGRTDLLERAAAAGCAGKIDVQRYVWAHRNEAGDSGSGYVYAASQGDWQNIVTAHAPASGDGGDGPEPAPVYYADWSVGPQSASGSFDSQFTVGVDKCQLETREKVDDAAIEIDPIIKNGSIDGGDWSLSPAAQTIITAGHTRDEQYQEHGGQGSASWGLHYSVTKTSDGGRSGSAGPYPSQEEANAAAESAGNDAANALRNEAQGKVNAAMAAARGQLATLNFRVNENTVPYGFGTTDSSMQTIAVQANGSATALIRNDEWSLQLGITKTDSETGQPIAAEAEFSIFEWDIVTQKYIPRGGYNQYKVERQRDDRYAVINHSDYATTDAMRHTLYFTQRNEGKFILVETKAPFGYVGDWTDPAAPGKANTPLGKRAYYIEITAANDGTVIRLDNAAYNADIAASYTGGTKLVTEEGVETTVTVGAAKDEARIYHTDPTGLAENEDSYTSIPVANVFHNDRVLGNIELSKVDLDAMKTLAPGSNGETTLEGAVYDLYAAEDIHHPDGVTGVVDYAKITDANGSPIWHTTILTNGGGWDANYLPILAKDHLVASAKIENGKLAFSNLYMGQYYLVERGTGLVLPIDRAGRYYTSGQYPTVNKRLETTGTYQPLAQNAAGEYMDYLYKNQYSSVAESRALSSVKTYDGYYLSCATGYLCDEVNHYQRLTYGGEAGYIIRSEGQSQDEVLKANFELTKLVSSTGSSTGAKLEGAGFTVYRISDLKQADRFVKNADGTYQLSSVLAAYRKDAYNQDTPKYDFSGEGQAVATAYESDTATLEHYNATLTADGDFANGRGKGCVPTDTPNEYRLAEIYSNVDGKIRVEGLAYGQYLVVETTIPKDVFQADPFIFVADETAPQSRFCVPAGSVTVASNSYTTYNILDEELEGYLQLVKIDAETGKAVKISNTAFSIYYLPEKGEPKLLTMTDPASGDAGEKTSVFYTDAEGRMKTPEKLPLGKYRIVEMEGPEGFYNNTQYCVDFELTSECVWEVTGNSTDDMDDYMIRESYVNHETLGQLIIRKTGNVLTGYEDGQFVYQQDNLADAVYEIHAHGDIATGDKQNTLWYASGDLVATITTGAEGQADQVAFAPTRTPATHNFLTVSHDGTKGEVTITLPLGSYDVQEVKAPYGFILTDQTYTVTFSWDKQSQDLVFAKTIISHVQDGDTETGFEIVNVKDASAQDLDAHKIIFENARTLPVPEKPGDKVTQVGVGIYKQDRETKAFLPGAVYDLYTVDAIYSASGEKLMEGGTKLATSAPTNDSGFSWFAVDVPICNEAIGNTGHYQIVETVTPQGNLLDAAPVDVYFTYENQNIAWQVVTGAQADLKADTLLIRKTDVGGKDLQGASLSIHDAGNKVVAAWVTDGKPHQISVSPKEDAMASALLFSDE